jgi:hypothetical protein
MRIEEHPFHVLGITPRSSLREIIEGAEDLNTRADPEKVNACRIRVTGPAKRLDAEVSWFPGLAPSRIQRVITVVEAGSKVVPKFEGELPGVDCLWAFNVLVYSLATSSDLGAELWEAALNSLTENFKRVDSGELMATINADRSAAGMPQVTDIAALVSALGRHEENAAAFVAERLARCPCHGEVLTVMLQHDANGDGADPCDFIPRVVDRYQILIQTTLSTFAQGAAWCCEEAISGAQASAQGKSTGGARVQAAIDRLEFALTQWGSSARPIQVLMKSRGLRDSASVETATIVRSKAVTLANDFGLHEEALRIIHTLYAEFGEVPELAELLEQDLETLNGIIAAQGVSRARGPRQRNDISCRECGGPAIADEAANGLNACADADCRAVQAFMQLCTSIETKCWREIQADGDHAADPAAAFREGYAEYRRQVSSWLAIICASGRDKTQVVRKARNAAAACLSSLAGGFTYASDLDQAQMLILQALPLVFDDAKLETEIARQLDYISAERQKLAPPAPQTARRPTPKPSTHPATGSPKAGAASGEKRGTASHAAPAFQSLFNGPATRYRWLLIAVPAIAILVCVLALVPRTGNLEGSSPQTDRGGAAASPIAGAAEPANPQPVTELSPAQLATPQPIAATVSRRAETRIQRAARIQPNTEPIWTEATKPAGGEWLAFQPAPKSPAAELPEPISLANGTDIAPPQGPSGLGVLTISNYTGGDAAVKLKSASSGYTVRFVYVCSRSDVTVSSIAPGSYVMQFATGRGWDATGHAFQRDRSFSAFDANLAFTERPTDDGVIYSSHKVTLHEVPNGNIRKKAISAAEFDQGGA